MQVVYAREEIPRSEKSLFLAGPTPRTHDVQSWRKEALIILEDLSFDGTVFVPEDRNGKWDESIEEDEQIRWEDNALHEATCIVFWIPRDLMTLPGFTTNVEYGRWMDSGKIVLGAPKNTPKMGYLDYYAGQYQIPRGYTLEVTLKLLIERFFR